MTNSRMTCGTGMPYKCVISDEAKREYMSIVEYLATVLKSLQAAAGFMDAFDEQLSLISANPDMFALSRMPELAARGYRAALVNNYVMLYKATDELIYIAHVFHQSQDYARLV